MGCQCAKSSENHVDIETTNPPPKVVPELEKKPDAQSKYESHIGDESKFKKTKKKKKKDDKAEKDEKVDKVDKEDKEQKEDKEEKETSEST